jgi:predicted RNase H-like HicB family nuclease
MNERRPLEYYLAQPYPYDVTPDEGAWVITFPDLPGCMTQIDDPAEIPAMAQEIRDLWLESAYDSDVPIPLPHDTSTYSGKFVVRLAKDLHRDLARAAETQGVSLNAYVAYLLAERHLTQQLDVRLERFEAFVGTRRTG